MVERCEDSQGNCFSNKQKKEKAIGGMELNIRKGEVKETKERVLEG